MRVEIAALQDEIRMASSELIVLQTEITRVTQESKDGKKWMPYHKERMAEDLDYEITVLRQACDRLEKQQRRLYDQYHFLYGPY